MSVIKGRKIKDWAVFTKVHVIYQGNVIFPGPSNPLKITIKPPSGTPGQPGYSAGVSAEVAGDPWILVDTFDSRACKSGSKGDRRRDWMIMLTKSS